MISLSTEQTDIIQLIKTDIANHPETKQEHVVNRLIGHYSRSYILTTIQKLITTGELSEYRIGRSRILKISSSSPSSSQKTHFRP